MTTRNEQDQSTYVHLDFYEDVEWDIAHANNMINDDLDALAEADAVVLGAQFVPVHIGSRNYLMVVIHYRATKRVALFGEEDT
jgi:hypothetical protein